MSIKPVRRRGRFRLTVALLVAVTAATVAAVPTATAEEVNGSVRVVLDGLSSPKGVDTLLGQPVVSQGAFGPPGPVLLRLDLPRFGHTFELSDPIGLVDVAVGPFGSLWGLGFTNTPDPEDSEAVIYRKTLFGSFEEVRNITQYQKTDPDPEDNEGIPDESNPYGLAVLPTGEALVADAANNDLLRITPSGDVTTVARFGRQRISTDHIPGFPGPTSILAEAVPTSIAVTPDGVLVGELKGFPFRPGTSRIWKVNPYGEDIHCSVRGSSPGCKPAGNGFTAIQDLAYDAKTKTRYVYELAADGVLAFEDGFETGEFPPAVLLKVRGGQRTELAAGELSQPGGVTVSPFGKLYVTDGVFGNGRLLEVK